MRIDSDDKILLMFATTGPLLGLISLLVPMAYFIGEPRFIVELWTLWWAILVMTYYLGILQAIVAGFMAQFLIKKIRSYWRFQVAMTVFTVIISSLVSVWDQYDMMSDIISKPTWQLTLIFGAFPALFASIVLGGITWRVWGIKAVPYVDLLDL